MFLDFNSSKIHFKAEGDGPAIVLLHGFMEDLSMWDAFIPALVSKCKVIRIDLLGHGKSDCISNVHRMETMADTVFSVLDYLGIEQIMLVGHSMGGYVALALIEKHPKIVTDAVLLNSTFEADSPERRELREKAIIQAQESKAAYEKLIRISFSNLFAPKSKETFKNSYAMALSKALQTPVCGYTAALRGMKLRPKRKGILEKIHGKKVIISGNKDNLIDLDTLKKETQNSPIELLEFSEGHMSYIENYTELSYFFEQFIEK